MSVFLREGEDIFHTYMTTDRGNDILHGTYDYLDLTPLGRQENWEEPLIAIIAHLWGGFASTTPINA